MTDKTTALTNAGARGEATMEIKTGLNWLLLFNAALSFVAVVLLTVSPDTIPQTVGFPITRDAHAMGYMLAAYELAIVVVYFFGRKLPSRNGLRLVVATGITFHIASALAQLLALSQDLAGNAVGANITLRLVIATLLLAYYKAPLKMKSATK